MIPDIGLPELLIILLIVLLLFGPGRLAKAMGDLGSGIRSFRDSMSRKTEEPARPETTPAEEN